MNFIHVDLIQRSFEQDPDRERFEEFYTHRKLNNPKNFRSFLKILIKMKYGVISMFLLFLPSAAFFSCGTSKNLEDEQIEQPESIPFTTIAQGALFGGGQEGFDEEKTTLSVIRTADEWEKLKTQLNSVNVVTGGFKDGDLDFEREMVIACIDRLRGSGGHEIAVDSILEDDNRLLVNIHHNGPGETSATVLTQPFYIVRITKSDKTLVVTEK